MAREYWRNVDPDEQRERLTRQVRDVWASRTTEERSRIGRARGNAGGPACLAKGAGIHKQTRAEKAELGRRRWKSTTAAQRRKAMLPVARASAEAARHRRAFKKLREQDPYLDALADLADAIEAATKKRRRARRRA